ncbi:MAG: hypothetical protein R3F55_22555 [Alphaproteobacteria bacterium]
MYRPDDHYLWDFWTAQRGSETHLFYLQAPRTPHDPELRHAGAQVGHAVSTDLRHWTYRGLAFGRGPRGAWDNQAIWTGSVIAHGNGWAMAYTGTSTAENGHIQRVGLALSDDLDAWTRVGDGLALQADLTLYRGQNPDHDNELAWRDPFLAKNPSGEGYLAYITAQVRDAAGGYPGCIALATSPDLVCWTVLPPVARDLGFFLMEVPQLVELGDRWALLFCARGNWIAPQHPFAGQSGTYAAFAESPAGPFRDPQLVLPAGRNGAYAAKVVERDGERVMMAWEGYQPYGGLAGSLTDPLPLPACLQRR